MQLTASGTLARLLRSSRQIESVALSLAWPEAQPSRVWAVPMCGRAAAAAVDAPLDRLLSGTLALAVLILLCLLVPSSLS